MDPERRRQLAQRGGRRAHELGTAHTYSSDEAREAGRKGGATTGAMRRAIVAERAADKEPKGAP